MQDDVLVRDETLKDSGIDFRIWPWNCLYVLIGYAHSRLHHFTHPPGSSDVKGWNEASDLKGIHNRKGKRNRGGGAKETKKEKIPRLRRPVKSLVILSLKHPHLSRLYAAG